MKISEMPAGREMDALVAEKVMGWTNLVKWEYGRRGIAGDWKVQQSVWKGLPPNSIHGDAAVPQYSTNITNAWQVVEKMQSEYSPISIQLDMYSDGTSVAWMDKRDGITKWARAETAPLAICRAALLAVEGEK